jgi:predicted RNA-binding protein with PUA-like domain
MAIYLLKTEPSEYSFDRLVKEKRCVWSGVSNNTALIHIRAMKAGDEAFIYHTGDEKAVVGLARVARGPYPDPERPELNAKGEPKFAVIDLEPAAKAKTPLTLAAIKADVRFKDFELVTQSRLSVMPVPGPLAKAIRGLTGV